MRMLACLAIAVATTSCASIITGGTDDILITSQPTGAYFRTNLGINGYTPQSIEVPDDKTLSVTFTMKGYEESSVHVGTRYSPWILGNIVFGGLIGLVIDIAVDGRVHSSSTVHANLVPSAAPTEDSVAKRNSEKAKDLSFEEWAAARQMQP